ncbi:MAG: cation transporter [Clostridia bacterium]|nr:cation transporter [Clostridia bacterium]
MTNLLLKTFIKDYSKTDNPKIRAAYGKLAGFVGIVCNFILFVAKILIGTISGSVSITADAVNNLSDASSSIVSLLGFKLAEKPADTEHPYGHGRYEYLSALSVAVIIILIGFELFKTSIGKIINPSTVNFSWVLVIVLSLSIIIKLWMMVFNNKLGKAIKSDTLIATAQDSRNDVISTLAVLLAAIISEFTSLQLDGWIGLGVAVFILVSGFGLIKGTIDPMLGRAPDAEFVKKVHDKIMSYDGVLGVHDLIVHDYGPCRQFASVHVEMAAEDDVLKSHDVIDNIEYDFIDDLGLNMIVHYDPIVTKNEVVSNMRYEISQIVKTINESLTIHDLRVVPGVTHTNLVFDCLANFDLGLSDYELKCAISDAVKSVHPEYNCVITIDKNYAPIP